MLLTLIGRGCTNAEVASQLYLGEATVKTHVNRIFAELGVRDRTQRLSPPRRRARLRFGRLLLAPLDNRCCAHLCGALRRSHFPAWWLRGLPSRGLIEA